PGGRGGGAPRRRARARRRRGGGAPGRRRRRGDGGGDRRRRTGGEGLRPARAPGPRAMGRAGRRHRPRRPRGGPPVAAPAAGPDPLRASSAGLGELLVAILAGSPAAVIVGVGGTATVDGGAGLRYVLPRWPGGVPLRVACDVRSPLVDAARVFARQKGASAAQAVELER